MADWRFERRQGGLERLEDIKLKRSISTLLVAMIFFAFISIYPSDSLFHLGTRSFAINV